MCDGAFRLSEEFSGDFYYFYCFFEEVGCAVLMTRCFANGIL